MFKNTPKCPVVYVIKYDFYSQFTSTNTFIYFQLYSNSLFSQATV